MEEIALYRNCRLGNKAEVAALLSKGLTLPTVRFKDPQDGNTPLHWVCCYGWLDEYVVLIEDYKCGIRDHCNVNKCQMTPIHHVFSDQGNIHIALYFMSKYGCIEIVKNILELSELSHSSSRQLLLKITRVSVDNGLWKPNDQNGDGDTVLHLACKAARPDIFDKMMSEFNCSQSIPNSDGKTPIQLQLCKEYPLIFPPDNKSISSDDFFEQFSIALSSLSCDECIQLLRLALNSVNCSWKQDDKTSNGNTALHLACMANKPEVVIFLLKVAKCDPNIPNDEGCTPIQLTPHFGIIYNLIDHGAVASPNIIMSLIVSSSIFDSSNVIQSTIDLLRLALKKSAWTPNEKAFGGDTALHHACKANKLTIVKFLLSEAKCDPNAKNNRGKMPIQLTSEVDIIVMLIEHGGTTCSATVFKLLYRVGYLLKCMNDDHEAVIKCFKIGINNTTWNPSDENDDGDTALYVACCLMNRRDIPMVQHIMKEIIHMLLSDAHCDPNILNSEGRTPLEVTRDPGILRDLIRYGAKSDMMYRSRYNALGINKPSLQAPVKVFVVGNPSVGKSTLVAALKKELSVIDRVFISAKVSDIEEKTAGVIPHEFKSRKYGCITLYDFAGQREFYSSHAALLQTVVQSSSPIFLLVVNLCNSTEEMKQDVLYWLSFLENQCTFVCQPPHVIIVGSHADQLISIGEDPWKKMSALDRLSFNNLRYAGVVAMDCQYSESRGMNELRQSITKSCNSLRTREDISFNAHCFYVYLLDRFRESSAIILSTIHSHIKAQQQHAKAKENALYFLPQSLGALYKICIELNDRGHLLFLKDSSVAENSWIITNKSILLSEVTGTIFAPEGFKQYKQLASNTGVVPLSVLVSQFPLHNPDMLIGFLTHLEFCHKISDQDLLQLITEQYSQSVNEHYYLFPGLIALNSPNNIWEGHSDYHYLCGWVLQSICPEQFFDSRFLQVLLLRLAFSFALVKSSEESTKHHPAIQRKCSLWKNGIFWGNRYGVETLVEVLPNSKTVVLLMRYSSRTVYLSQMMNLLSSVIRMVLLCVQEFCPRVKISESLIDLTEVVNYPLKPLSALTHFTIQAVASAAVESWHGQPISVVSSTGITRPLQHLLTFEPFAELNKQIIQVLHSEQSSRKIISDQFVLTLLRCISASKYANFFDEIFRDISDPSNIADQRCSVHDNTKLFQGLYEWKKRCEVTYQCLREKMGQYSIFAERNILVSKTIVNYGCIILGYD